jgi:CBS-domain-containing membrane protein
MTPFPWHVHLDDHLGHAREVMRERGIRHLPVTDDGELVGIVTDRDIGLVENATREPASAFSTRTWSSSLSRSTGCSTRWPNATSIPRSW